MPAETIDGVIEELTAIIDRTRSGELRTGYFPALYREVTRRVREGIAGERFDDPDRMERLDVTFANRYLRAVEERRGDGSPTRSWHETFEAAEAWSPLILQHLLLGMNAHINLDLGIAAAEVSEAGRLDDLENDFREINAILGAMIDAVQRRLATHSPWMGVLDRLGGEADEVISNFALRAAREDAWQFARDLAGVDRERWPDLIEQKDRVTARRAEEIRHPGGWWARPILLAARFRETAAPSAVIDDLADWE